MHSDGKKRRSFVALLFAAGDLRRWAIARTEEEILRFFGILHEIPKN
jgi:hypothetical protein